MTNEPKVETSSDLPRAGICLPNFVNLPKSSKNARKLDMVSKQHTDNLWKSSVQKLLRMQKVAQKEQHCLKYEKFPKSCRTTCGHP